MNNSTTVDEGQIQGRNRRASDQSRTTGSQSRFNPLHPSMELPPEQLIRLLGLEDKISRKKQKTRPSNRPEPKPAAMAVAATPVAKPEREPAEKTLPKVEVPTDHQMYQKRRRTRTDASPFVPQRTSMLPKAIGFSVVAGIAVSAYVFWWQPASEPEQPLPVAESTPIPARPPAPATPVTKPAATGQAAGRPQAVAPPARATAAPVHETVAAPVKRETAPIEDPRWRAAVEAREQRLRDAAQQRLSDRMHAGETAAMPGPASATPPADLSPVAAQPTQPIPPVSADSEFVTADPATETQVPQQDPSLSVGDEAAGMEEITLPAAAGAEDITPPSAVDTEVEVPAQPLPAAELEEIPLPAPEAEMGEPVEPVTPSDAPIAPGAAAATPGAADTTTFEPLDTTREVTETSADPVSPDNVTGSEIAEPAETAPVDYTATGEPPAVDTAEQTQGDVF